MRKGLRKLVAIVLTTTMIMGISLPAFAEVTKVDVVPEMVVSAQAVAVAQDKVGLDNYLSYDEKNLIVFNQKEAIRDGYSVTAVEAVAANITKMNELVRTGEAVPTENFSVTSFSATSRVVAAGISDVQYHWDGRVEYYLNSTEARYFYNGFTVGYTIADAASRALVFCSGSAPLIAMGTIGVVYSNALYANLTDAYLQGTGIVMTLQVDSASGTQHIWFMAQ